MDFWTRILIVMGVSGHAKLVSSNVWMLLDVMSSPSVCCWDSNRRDGTNLPF